MTPSRSLTVRLALAFAATSAGVLLVLGAIVGHLVVHHFEKLDRVELDGVVTMIRHMAGEMRDPSALAALPGKLDDALYGHLGLSVILAGADGKPLYVSGPACFPAAPFTIEAPPDDALLAWQLNGHSYRGLLATSATGDGRPLYIAVALDLAHHADFLATFYRTLWASVAGSIVLASLAGWFAARRGLMPLRAMAEVARGISAEQLHERLGTDEVPAEMLDLAQTFNGMLARLEDSFRRLSDFSSDIAHELRTPVNNLMTQTEVALSRARSAEQYKEILYANLEEYGRLGRMISDMLFIAKADNGLLELRKAPCDMGRIADGLVDFYQALAEDKGLTLHREGDCVVLGEQDMLRRALSNLLSNAIRHTPPGGKVHIRLGTDAEHHARIAVENIGDLISAEQLPRLFDRFYRADPARRRDAEGSGLGLVIVKSIVEAHGGTVAASCDHGTTRFLIRLPAVA